MDKGKLIDEILNAMQGDLDAEQLRKLESVLVIKTHDLRIEEECTALTVSRRAWEKVLRNFRACKRLENCAESTLEGYTRILTNMYQSIGKPIDKITGDDLRYYMAVYQYRNGPDQVLSLSYMNDIRHCFSSFFGWAYAEEYIDRDPSKKLRKIRVPEKMVETYSQYERVKLLECTKTDRDRALQHCLYSSGARIGEILQLNKDDIVYVGRRAEAIVRETKGKAERKLLFSEDAVFFLNRYLAGRKDDNPALFVSNRAPHNRLGKGGAQAMFHKLGEAAGIHCHAHKYRSSMATDMCARGCPIEVTSKLLGHKKLDTTMKYRKVSEDELRQAHSKYAA